MSKTYAIHGKPCKTYCWCHVSKEPGMPWTTTKSKIRTYKTYAGAIRAMELLKATAPHWNGISNATGNMCEVYAV